MTPEDYQRLLAAQAQTAALTEQRRQQALRRREALAIRPAAPRPAAARRQAWPIILTAAFALLIALALLIGTLRDGVEGLTGS